mgnify:CR=1 FL=1
MDERQQIQSEIDNLQDELDRALASGDEDWVNAISEQLDYLVAALENVVAFDADN